MADYIVNGYAYPTISERSLEWWLPRLAWVSCFSYGFTAEGDLIDLDDEALVSSAKDYGVRPLMVLTPLDSEGMFNDNIAKMVLDDEYATQNLIYNIEANLEEKGMDGVDFDFEYLSADYAAKYARLVEQTRLLLKPQGYLTNVALAPKTSSEQKGLLYQGHDYKAMGGAADYCLLMTYEWGYTYGPPMPVSPIDNVRRVVEYGLSQIPAEKILLGMSNYGYDWEEPFVKGKTRAEKLTNYQAEARAKYYGAEVGYDETAQAPYYRYTAPNGAEHVVWFENEGSWLARLGLVEEYGLAGVSIWNTMSVFYGGL